MDATDESLIDSFDGHETPFVVHELRLKADLFKQRHALYGDNYHRFGHIMGYLFPDGLHLLDHHDHNRFGVLVQVVSKLTRYAQNFQAGGHDDSLDDMAVYAMMLKELDNLARNPEDYRDAN